ncbi:MAG: hemolysin family protein [Acidimicrobiales bacterium]
MFGKHDNAGRGSRRVGGDLRYTRRGRRGVIEGRRGRHGETGTTEGTGERADHDAESQLRVITEALNDLDTMVVREVMTPRVDVVGLAIPVAAEDVTRAVRESGHRSFPVYDEDLDDLVGVLFVNDLFRAGWRMTGWPAGAEPGRPNSEADEAGGTLRGAPVDRPLPESLQVSRRLRQPFLVPESLPVLDVLAEMRRQRRAFAVVVDEHGGVEGVLTIKDILAALVGDLPDEFDPPDEPDVVRVDQNRWLLDGRMGVDDVRERLAIDVPDGEYVTLGGFLFERFGHIPIEGEAVAVDGWDLRVAEMDRRRIAKVVARRTPSTEPGPAGPVPDRPDLAARHPAVE